MESDKKRASGPLGKTGNDAYEPSVAAKIYAKIYAGRESLHYEPSRHP